MRTFRFIHAADIHLGSILNAEGFEDLPKLQEISREATYLGFSRICQTAIQAKVDFILISGDLYDREARSVRANRFFVDSCRELEREGIQVLVTAGNHDPVREYGELFELPGNVHLFSADQPEQIVIKSQTGEPIASVAGQSYGDSRERTPLYRHYPISQDEVFRIAMLHTQLESQNSNYIPASLGELTANSGFDYWALGHIHQPRILHKENPVVAYSGTPQGRDFGEQGAGGCWLVEVDDFNGVEMEYWITSPVVYHSLYVDIGCPELKESDNLNQLEDYILQLCQELIRQDGSLQVTAQWEEQAFPIEGFLIRVEIGGRGKLHSYLSGDLRGSEEEICRTLRRTLGSQKPFIWADSVTIRTADPITAEVLHRHPLLQELLDLTVLSIKEDPKVRENLVSNLGQAWAWTAMPNYEDQESLKLSLDPSTLDKMMEDAVRLLLEGLADGGEG